MCSQTVRIKSTRSRNGRLRFSDLNFEIVHEKARKYDYQKVKLVSLEEALSPVESFFSNLRNQVKHAKESCPRPIPNNLTLDESSAIRIYSRESASSKDCLYLILNETLRNSNPEQIKPWLYYIKLLMTAIYKIQPEPQVLFRGIKLNISYHYIKGKSVVWHGFSSCTKALDVLETEEFLGRRNPRTVFIIESFSGRDITKHCYSIEEAEVILPPERQFIVLGNIELDSNLFMVHLKEEHSTEISASVISTSSTFHEIDSFYGPTSPCKNIKLQQILHNCVPRFEAPYLQINDNDMHHVVRAIISSTESTSATEKCTYIDLSGNEFTHVGVVGIGVILTRSKYIRTLILGDNHLNDDDIDVILTAFNHHNAINVLNLAMNNITDLGLRKIVDFLKMSKSLVSLNLNTNQISDKGMNKLAEVLVTQKYLRELYVSKNKITDISVDRIAIMLNDNQTLERVDLDLNRFSESQKERLNRQARSKMDFVFAI